MGPSLISAYPYHKPGEICYSQAWITQSKNSNHEGREMPRKRKTTDAYEELLRKEEELAAARAKWADNRNAAMALAGEIMMGSNPEGVRNRIEEVATEDQKERLAAYGWKRIVSQFMENKKRAEERAKAKAGAEPRRPSLREDTPPSQEETSEPSLSLVEAENDPWTEP
jgi:hypothetical protein